MTPPLLPLLPRETLRYDGSRYQHVREYPDFTPGTESHAGVARLPEPPERPLTRRHPERRA